MSKVYLTRRIIFAASHRLHAPQLSDEENHRIFDKCNYIHGHGHNYTLFVTISGTPDPITGMIINLVEFKDILTRIIIDKVDHKHLNFDVDEFKTLNPTVENMVIVFWDWLKNALPAGLLHEIKLYETENNIAIYRGE